MKLPELTFNDKLDVEVPSVADNRRYIKQQLFGMLYGGSNIDEEPQAVVEVPAPEDLPPPKSAQEFLARKRRAAHKRSLDGNNKAKRRGRDKTKKRAHTTRMSLRK